MLDSALKVINESNPTDLRPHGLAVGRDGVVTRLRYQSAGGAPVK
jgi:hypothetical protein